MAVPLAITTLLFVVLGHPAEAAFSFITLGDWGGAALGGYHESNEKAVATQLGKSAQEMGAQFIINTGDNFYYCGTKDLGDEQFQQDFESIYTAESLFVPWYGVLGNHDYPFSADSQISYRSPNKDRWQMPDRNYTKRVLLGGSQYATFVFLDTSPCIKAYRSEDPKGWDPCSGQYHDDCGDASGTCRFHDHVISQDCSAQFRWLEAALAAVDKKDWLIAVGHHPANEINVEDFTSALLRAGVRLYLNGHTHALIHYKISDHEDVDFVTSGAGAMVHTYDQDQVRETLVPHKEVFHKKVSGFTTHTFSEDFSALTTSFVDTTGGVVHSFTTSKTGRAPLGPSTGPPPPGDAASCERYGCGTYSPDQKCQCNAPCKEHSDCCDDHGEVCGRTGVVV